PRRRHAGQVTEVHMRSGLLPLAAAALLVNVVSASAWAGVPGVITEQGRLFDSTGVPLTASMAITFSIYDAPAGGSLLWTETQTIALDQGYFSAELGSVTPFSSTVWDGAQRWIGITVGTDPEMTPRQPTD